MTFSYTSPDASSSDTVRFLIGDTVADEAQLSDEEISWLVRTWQSKGSMYYVAAMAAESIAAKYTREVVVQSDGQTIDLGPLQAKYLALAETLRAQHRDLLVGGADLHVGGMDADQEPDPGVAPLAFGTQMHDNRWAGRQDYGDANTNLSTDVQWGEKVP